MAEGALIMGFRLGNTFNYTSTLDKTQQRSQQTNESLASGKRINKAADDSAGLVIANRLTSEVNSLSVKTQGAQDQVNLNNVQNARLSAITDGLARAQTLSVQSGNPLYQNSSAIQDELTAIGEQINAVAEEALGQSNFITGLSSSDPATTQANIDAALKTVGDEAAKLGADSNALAAQINSYQTSQVNLAESRSRIEDTDIAAATSERSKNNTLEQIALSVEKSQQERKGLLIDKLL